MDYRLHYLPVCSVAFVFMQVIIKDSSIVLTLAHIKAYMVQTFLGLEYLHVHWILHRVSYFSETPCIEKHVLYSSRV